MVRIAILAITLIGITFNCWAQNSKLPVEDMERFTTVVQHIKNYYVKPTTDGEIFESAIRGMLAGLDPHSNYLNKEEYADLKADTSGQFSGLGIEVTLEDGFIRVITPIDDTPAQIAGIKAGDLIIKLNGVAIKGMTLREAVNKMRGKKGTKITLDIIRKGESQPLNILVTRDNINTTSVKAKILGEGFGYIRIAQFETDTGEELLNGLQKLRTENHGKLKGLVLDLRNNAGGVLESSVAVADAFLDKNQLGTNKVIVAAQGRTSSSQLKESATAGDKLHNAPIVVLVNSGSASASEIVAGALQDHKRAIIMGIRTFGKGSVQTILPLKNQRGLKLTTALYYTPNGRSIQAIGITPDIMVPDIDLPEEKENPLKALMWREADLQGHLETKQTKKATNKIGSDAKNLLAKDYQLYQALLMLKGISLLKN